MSRVVWLLTETNTFYQDRSSVLLLQQSGPVLWTFYLKSSFFLIKIRLYWIWLGSYGPRGECLYFNYCMMTGSGLSTTQINIQSSSTQELQSIQIIPISMIPMNRCKYNFKPPVSQLPIDFYHPNSLPGLSNLTLQRYLFRL